MNFLRGWLDLEALGRTSIWAARREQVILMHAAAGIWNSTFHWWVRASQLNRRRCILSFGWKFFGRMVGTWKPSWMVTWCDQGLHHHFRAVASMTGILWPSRLIFFLFDCSDCFLMTSFLPKINKEKKKRETILKNSLEKIKIELFCDRSMMLWLDFVL